MSYKSSTHSVPVSATEPEQSIVQNSLPQCDSGFCPCQIVFGQLCHCASGSLCFFASTVYPGSENVLCLWQHVITHEMIHNGLWAHKLENHFMCLNRLEEVTSRVYFQFLQSTDIKNKSATWQYKLNFTSSLSLLKYFKSLCRTLKYTTKVFWETVILIWIQLLFSAAPCNAEHQLVSWSLPLKNTDVWKYIILGSLPALSRDFSLLLCCLTRPKLCM